jgi:RNA polymerase sigma factor (sigma-70 family)
MQTGPLTSFFRLFRRQVALCDAGDRTDGELLRRFASSRDEDAFAALVERHGPLVLGVCRRLLPDADDVEDAFQATFLVLARKANSLGQVGRLAAWLYGVAVRVARKARAGTARRHARQRPLADVPAAEPDRGAEWNELCRVLDDEVQRLPEKFRGPLVLCYLQGRTREEAAALLGSSAGAVKGMLERGRELLRARLVRRGLAPSAAALAVGLSGGALSAAVPAALGNTTVKATALFTTGKAAGNAAALAEGALRTMGTSRTKIALAALLTLGLLGTGAVVLALGGRPPEVPGQAALPPPAPGEEGEKLFRAMEAKIKAARAVRIAVEIELSALKGKEEEFDLKGEPGKYTGTLLFTKDNKARLKIRRGFVGMEMVSDGKQLKLAYGEGEVRSIEEAKAQPTPKQLHGLLSTLVSRVGVEIPALLMHRLLKIGIAEGPLDLKALRWGVWDFKVVGTEKVGGRDARVVSYRWGPIGHVNRDEKYPRFTLWIDTRTQLPLKHVSAIETTQVTEVYTEFNLDPRIGPREFELVPDPGNAAEKWFRAMEAKLHEARAVQVTFDLELKGEDRQGKFKGSLLYTKDNKARLKMSGKEKGIKVTREMVSDGKRLKAEEVPEEFDAATDGATPADLHRRLSTLVSRAGLRGYNFIFLRGSAEADRDLFRVADFEGGGTEKVRGREARVVRFNATMRTESAGTYQVTVWIDARTLLPLKRVIVPEGGEGERITEICDVTLDPKIDAGAFALPVKR